MAKQEAYLAGLQHLDEPAVVIEIATVGGGSGAPLVCVDQFEPGGHVAKETAIQQQIDTSAHQLVAHDLVHFGIGGANKIGETFSVVFVLTAHACGHSMQHVDAIGITV